MNESASARLPSPAPSYLSGLNPEQRAAVEATEGPVLVLAGAGTGKTRVLTTRIAHLLRQRRAFPSQILAVTFTNKAAREMQHRIGALIGEAVEGMPWLGTFHSVAARILRRHAEAVGLKPNFSILDTDDQVRLCKQVIQAADLDEKRWPGRGLASQIDKWKNRGLAPHEVPTQDADSFADGRGVELYAAYQARLLTLNAADFGDLLLLNLKLFRERPDILGEFHRRFRYILVDEYQDTNVAQYLWLRLLAQGSRNIACVGDDDQSIYGWRGAEVGNILRFEADFPGATVIRLERNYRSTGHILGAASGLIAANRSRLGKTLWTEDAAGEPVRVTAFWDGEEEARAVADAIEQLNREGEKLSEIAILVRASFQTRSFEERFILIGLPYRVLGGPRFYERQEIRDALAYLRVVHQPDDDLAFERIINTPRRGLGDTTIQTLSRLARARGLSLLGAAVEAVETDEIKARARSALRALMADLARWRGQLETASHTDLARTILDESGYTAMWQADRSADAPGRLENLKELVQAMGEFPTLAAFLDHVSLVMENEADQTGDQVTLMTLHGAKGLEFGNVFLPGWEEGLFPSQRTLDESGIAGLEEERRLAYVGITRARRRSFISYAANRRIYNQWQSAVPSRFVEELPPEHVERSAPPGLDPRGPTRFDVVEADDFGSRATSPGWRRAQSAFAADPRARRSTAETQRLVDAQPALLAVSDPAAQKFGRGDRVFHQKFGYGRITGVEGNRLEIAFEHSGSKKVLDSFVTKG
ncbi:ATP-dependent helicase [Zavarzinia sp. CC-PAN008]|uniref:ATP-dependent helicase n=1 Tax=Zavarzinia sp. CC-PAN008 TaxID=3243332 RepID=UPI003F745F7A